MGEDKSYLVINTIGVVTGAIGVFWKLSTGEWASLLLFILLTGLNLGFLARNVKRARRGR